MKIYEVEENFEHLVSIDFFVKSHYNFSTYRSKILIILITNLYHNIIYIEKKIMELINEMIESINCYLIPMYLY